MTDAVDRYLADVFGVEIPQPGLHRVGRLYRALLGDAPVSATNIAVGGTNGKGSTAAALGFAFQSTGYSVLSFTSPHILDVRERITINGRKLPESFWLSSLQHVRRETAGLGLTVSYFEAIFGVALLACKVYAPEVVIWEAGLGGRLDAINVIPGFECVVITTVGLDHCEILGDTTLKIAREKVALGRRLSPLILGDIDTGVQDQVRPELQAQRVLVISARDAIPPAWLRQLEQIREHLPWLTVDCARALVWALIVLDRWIPDELDWSAMPAIPGRLDRSRWPWIVDVGHNPDAAANLCRQRTKWGDECVDLCFNALPRKDVVTMARVLARPDLWRKVWIYDDNQAEFASSAELVELFEASGCKVDTIKGSDFFTTVPECPTVVFGSFRLAAKVLPPFEPPQS